MADMKGNMADMKGKMADMYREDMYGNMVSVGIWSSTNIQPSKTHNYLQPDLITVTLIRAVSILIFISHPLY